MAKKAGKIPSSKVQCPGCHKPIVVHWPDPAITYQDAKCPRCWRSYVGAWRDRKAKDTFNSQVVMTGGERVPRRMRDAGTVPGESVCVPTSDKSDRAHSQMDETKWGLKPAKKVPHAEPRRYHPCYMVTILNERKRDGRVYRKFTAVSFETGLDKAHEREVWLAESELMPMPPNTGALIREAMARKEAR